MKLGVAGLVAALLGGCGDAAPDAQPPDAMATEAETKSGRGTGTVTALDAAGGTITIEHGPMPEVGWSAMTMTFEVSPALLAGVDEGDTVAFDLTVSRGRGTLTALSVQ